MAETKVQNLSNHTRFDPMFHFFIVPVFFITWVISVVMLVRGPGWFSAWRVVAATALLLLPLKARLYSLRVQDRVIRLEERLRLAQLMPEGQRGQILALTEGQLIGLRFASDDEAPALAQRACTEKLSRSDIKKAVQTWRADHWRV
jgi:hypothetical protein